MPVRVSPPLRMKTAQMVTTAGLLNPASASLGLTISVTANTPMTSMASTSRGAHSVTRRIMTATRIASTVMISGVIRLIPFGIVGIF